MISDRSLLKLSVSVSAIGIISLLVSASFVKPHAYDIFEINDAMAGKAVTVSGTAHSVAEKNGNIFIDLYDGTGSIDVVYFNAPETVVKKGSNLTVYGKVAIYNGRLEIIANEISFV